jgi:hypothetical protein
MLGTIGSVLTPTVNRNVSVDQSTILKWLFRILLAVVVIYFVFPSIRDFFKLPIRVKDAQFVPGDGSVDVDGKRGFYEALVQSLYLSLKTNYTNPFSTSPRCRAFERWYRELNLNEFRHCCNVFKNTYKKTVRALVQETYVSGCGTGTDYSKLFNQRLDALGIA